MTDTPNSSSKMQEKVMQKDDVVAERTVASKAEKEVIAMKNGIYGPYQDGVIGNGAISVLFFHASWCGECKEANEHLTEWFSAESEKFLNVYKVDYDSSSDLRQRYGVTYQHTFVKIDGQGNPMKKIQGPTDQLLKQLIQR